MNKLVINRLFKYFVLAGNLVYFLWILDNGVDDGFKGGLVMLVSSVGLLILLILNIFIISKK